jgi:hypothetical protein
LFQKDITPIIFTLPKEQQFINLYFIHDLHFGSELFDVRKWCKLKEKILDDENAYVMWIGDLMENAIPNSKSDMFSQTHSPSEQKEWVTIQLQELAHKTIAVVSGNHEYNRTTKASGLHPLYDCCLLAGIGDKYRSVIAFVDIGLGLRRGGQKQVHYFGQIQHKAKDVKTVHSADYTDGIDFFASGHDHETKDKPRAKLVFDKQNKVILKRNVECINCGSFCEFGGYGAKAAYRPQSDKMYILRLYGNEKKMETIGFYV